MDYFCKSQCTLDMKHILITVLMVPLFFNCKFRKAQDPTDGGITGIKDIEVDFVIAFGSCNKADKENLLWDDILASKPDVWVWGGDNIYADTKDMEVLRTMYRAQNRVTGYKALKNKVPIIGTWDDHDYGLNDGGVEFGAKRGSQREFLNFMAVPESSPRREREGIYASHVYHVPGGNVKIIVLDTRYFRTALSPDNTTEKRFKPNADVGGTVLGEQQWKWLERELKTSQADFNVIVSSIQFLSDEHGFECWGNFPHEVDRLKHMLVTSRAKRVLFISGDRHISEFSSAAVEGLSYPLIDFTSSGLTHTYSGFQGEPNPYRVGNVVSTESFGLIQFDFKAKKAQFKMLGDKGAILGAIQQAY